MTRVNTQHCPLFERESPLKSILIRYNNGDMYLFNKKSGPSNIIIINNGLL